MFLGGLQVGLPCPAGIPRNSHFLQVAAGTLDASAKIYAVRVDCVHADTFRVLSHLGKETAPARDPDSPQQGGNSLFSSPKTPGIPSFLTRDLWEF